MTSNLYWIQGLWKKKFKIIKVMKFTSKTKFKHLLLNITFNDTFKDLILVFYTWVLNTTIEVNMKKCSIKKHFATTFRHLTIKTMVIKYWINFLVHFTILVGLRNTSMYIDYSKISALTLCKMIVAMNKLRDAPPSKVEA